jgi:predicted aspartyl protease
MRAVSRTILLAALTVTAACQPDPGPVAVVTPPDSASGEVGFELTGPGGAALMVPVHVNGEGPFNFILDTGATLICLDQELVRRLEVPVDETRGGMATGIERTGRIQLVGLDSVRVGSARAESLSACVLDLAHTQALGLDFDGLIGLNFLREFRVTLDFTRNVLILQ